MVEIKKACQKCSKTKVKLFKTRVREQRTYYINKKKKVTRKVTVARWFCKECKRKEKNKWNGKIIFPTNPDDRYDA